MTCIAAMVDNKGTIWMAADSGYVIGEQSTRLRSSSPKIIKRDKMIFGVAGEGGPIMRCLSSTGVIFSAQSSDTVDHEYLTHVVAPAIQDAVVDAFIIEVRDWDFYLIIGYNSKLYVICSDFEVYEVSDEYEAIGVGAEVAKGVLYTYDVYSEDTLSDVPVKDKVKTAVEASIFHVTGVEGPVIVKSL